MRDGFNERGFKEICALRHLFYSMYVSYYMNSNLLYVTYYMSGSKRVCLEILSWKWCF